MTHTKNDSVEKSLFEKRKKLYPREVHGLFANLRLLGVTVLLGLYYILPWINRNDHQIILFDLPARKFYIFDWVFWPQDFIYITLLLICAALALFLFTAVAGRLWCGYACPQTVWTEVFLWIERKVEGSRSQQMKLDSQSLTFRKFRIKATKHSIWILFSAFTGFTFVGFFTPIRELADGILQLQLSPWATFWLVFYSLATYGNAGWLREQVCTYMCPYARFQSVMLDKNTLVVSYDENRGEPRGRRKRSDVEKTKQLGSCIDCTLCVQVCPTGIDIRNGLQYECIGCAACIDVCDDVMEQMNYEPGLIRYTTENALDGKKEKILRPRIIIYSIILVSLLSTVFYSIQTRNPVGLDVIRDRNALYRESYDGTISNTYTLKLLNMDLVDHEYLLTIKGLNILKNSLNKPIQVKSGQVVEAPLLLSVEPDSLENQTSEIIFELRSVDSPELRTQTKARFIGPLEL